MSYAEREGRNDWPDFSIIILTFRNQRLVYKMLDSVFQQDYPNIHLIISDDGTPDFDAEEIERYIDEHKSDNIRSSIVRANPQNMGTVKHVHAVLQSVDSEYFVLTAADDLFCGDNVISEYVKAFERNADKGWVVARTNITTADYKRIIHTLPSVEDIPYFKQHDPVRLFSRWSRRGMAVPCCMAFKKSVVEAVGGIDLDYVYLEDWPLVLRLLRNGYAPIFLNQVTAMHSAGGVTNSNNTYGIEVRKRFFKDKDLVYTKEVVPFLDLLTPVDKEALRKYRAEICDRNYFLDITWNLASRKEKLWMLLKKKYFVWLLEKYFEQFERYLRKPKMLLIAHLLCLCSAFLLNSASAGFLTPVFRILGYADFAVAVLVVLAAFAAIPIGRHVRKMRELRRSLVN